MIDVTILEFKQILMTDSVTDGKTINTNGDDEIDKEESQTIQRLDPQKHVHQQSDQSKNLNYDADILIEAMGQSEAQHDESFAKESGAKLDSPTTKGENKWMILAFSALALSGVIFGILSAIIVALKRRFRYNDITK